MKFVGSLMALVLIACGCSRLETLTTDSLRRAEARWNQSPTPAYEMVVEMEGDRVEKGQFEVRVENGVVTSLRRNGKVVALVSGQDYSMPGLFRIIEEEMDLATDPVRLGGEPGYTVYLLAHFDDASGRLLEYQRSVGGISNSIHIKVVSFSPR